MGQAVPVRTDYTAGEVRRFARRAKDGAQARRLLALAAVLDGASREEAAKIGGMDRQTLRDWVIRYNEQGPDGLINIPSPGAPPKLDDTQKPLVHEIRRNAPALRYWTCKDCGAEWTSDAPEIERNKEVDRKRLRSAAPRLRLLSAFGFP